MKISIIGHGHLAYVTAACMEQFHTVNVDDNKTDESDLIWVCYDTPVDAMGKPNSKQMIDKLNAILLKARVGTTILISSQVPVGTCANLQKDNALLVIAYSPENLRRGKAINDFMNPDRIVVGCHPKSVEIITKLFEPLKRPILWMSVESAEMVKHALNSYLALSIAFINEIDQVCKIVGANSESVAEGLQTDKRIGKLSYLKPGGPYTNDTLGREIYTLIDIDKKFKIGLNIIQATKKSNDEHSNNRA